MILSIVIPMYKAELYIGKCLESCIRQDISINDFEIICVNDGSPDKSASIATVIANNHENIRIINQDNGGLSSARNAGIKNASGDYLFFLDSDDWIAENSLGKIVCKIKTEKPDVLCICAADASNDGIRRRFSYLDETPKEGRNAVRWDMSPCAPFYVIRTQFFLDNGFHFYEGILHEDSELIPRVLFLAEKVSYINDVIYYVYQSPGSITRTVNPKRSFDLINHVCKSLDNFSQTIEPEYRRVFHNMISLYINNSLSYILPCEEEKRREFQTLLMEKDYLFKHLRKASHIKYRMEFLLFSMCPNRILALYKWMKRL